MINGVGDILARNLMDELGDAEAVFKESARALSKIHGISSGIVSEIKRADLLCRAESELSFVEKNGISIYFYQDSNYPERLRECPDAPVLFYYKGAANLNSAHVISIVGTRNASSYGVEQTEQLLGDISKSFPGLLIVSGLAYGIDICAHRCALKYSLPTVAVLAHGLDRIYPSLHRTTAVEMLRDGGLLTDFPSGTNPDRQNFIKRNRIVAGLSEATIVIESAEKGGSLITADIAFSYGRDVFSFPGRVTDIHSRGCNNLIRQNKAELITCADDLISSMRWDVGLNAGELPKQTQLIFPDNGDDNPIVSYLIQHKEAHINELSVSLGLPIQQLSTLLFELEMDGRIKSMPGSVYKLT